MSIFNNQKKGDQPNNEPNNPLNPSNVDANSTQKVLKIAEIRDGVVIMEDGSYRLVVFANSINFDLMSQEEREGVEIGYQGFINSLHFPTQIFIKSQKINIDQYVDKLENIKSSQDNILLGVLMDNYLDFIDGLTSEMNIMDKKFYVIVPLFPNASVEDAKHRTAGFAKTITTMFTGGRTTTNRLVISRKDYEDARIELKNRAQLILSGLASVGVQGAALDTQELIELYYGVYNPDTATNQSLSRNTAINSPAIRKEGV